MNNELEQHSAPAKKEETGGFLFDALEMFVWAFAILLLIFTFAFRLCRVEGASMENTLYDNENLLLYSLAYEPQQDDIVVFHLTDKEPNLEKMLVKRVIAKGLDKFKGGDKVKVDFFLNGRKWDNPKTGKTQYFTTLRIASIFADGEGGEQEEEQAVDEEPIDGDIDDMPF